ncbi:hypothetical protein B296_00009632 [Ensete ventricosum]|uniref:Uncharacterized protein n=1 Tax=Ensete ventricosum TaxID=4639 RepID=A0A427AVG5_ENSVE|nr:hypothetical protein B296_00009632 [Ensete ventricosum]
MHGVGDGETSQEKTRRAPSFLDLGRACFPAAKKRSPCTHRRQPPIGVILPPMPNATTPTCMHPFRRVNSAPMIPKARSAGRLHAFAPLKCSLLYAWKRKPMPNSSSPNARHIYQRHDHLS